VRGDRHRQSERKKKAGHCRRESTHRRALPEPPEAFRPLWARQVLVRRWWVDAVDDDPVDAAIGIAAT
jgi:hypothetical protein